MVPHKSGYDAGDASEHAVGVTYESRGGTSDFRLQTSDFQSSDLGLKILDLS